MCISPCAAPACDAGTAPVPELEDLCLLAALRSGWPTRVASGPLRSWLGCTLDGSAAVTHAALALAENSDRDVDASFVGRLHRLPEENLPNQRMNRITWENRRWVVAFARTFFTAASVFVDTTARDPAAYERLGPYDASAGAAASYRPTSSTRDGIDAGDAHRCAKASCDGAYYAALRAGKECEIPNFKGS